MTRQASATVELSAACPSGCGRLLRPSTRKAIDGCGVPVEREVVRSDARLLLVDRDVNIDGPGGVLLRTRRSRPREMAITSALPLDPRVAGALGSSGALGKTWPNGSNRIDLNAAGAPRAGTTIIRIYPEEPTHR